MYYWLFITINLTHLILIEKYKMIVFTIAFAIIIRVCVQAHWVSDKSHFYLSHNDETELSTMMETKIINNTFARIQCDGTPNGKINVEVAVVLLKTNEWKISYNEAGTQMFDKLALGDKKCNSGLLVLIFVDDRRLVVKKGHALKPYIHMIDHKVLTPIFAPYAKKQEYKYGVVAVIDKLHEVFTTYEPTTHNMSKDEVKASLTIGFLLAVAVIMVSTFACVAHCNDNPHNPNVTKTIKFAKYIKDNNKQFDDACCICFDKMIIGDNSKQIVSTKCGHIFHNECIVSWTEKHPTCPLCRKNLKVSSKQVTTCTNNITRNYIDNIFTYLIADNSYDEMYITTNNPFSRIPYPSYYSSHSSYVDYSHDVFGTHDRSDMSTFLNSAFQAIGSGGTCDSDVDVGSW